MNIDFPLLCKRLPEGTCIQVMWKEETMPYTSHDWEW